MPIIVKPKKQTVALLFLILFGFLASGFTLKMPFSSQAPEGNWNEPWFNDCEEVSIMMVDSFYNNKVLTPAISKKEILKIIGIKEEAFGFSLNENADKIVDLVNNYLNSNWQARIADNPDIEEIKNEIDAGRPVLFLADGRKLNNRYFITSHYHVFVISGYDDKNEMFTAQEPGTRRGHDYQYSYATIENAMHDYNSEDLAKGRRVAIFTGLKKKESEKIESGAEEAKKTNGPKVEASPASTVIVGSDILKSEETKKDDLFVASGKSVQDSGLVKMTRGYWNNFIELIKKTFK